MASNRCSFVVLLFVFLLSSNANAFWFSNNNQVADNGGGTPCAVCTIVVGLLEQLVVIHNTTIDKLLDDVCNLFPSEFTSICDFYVNKYGEDVIALIEARETADSVCHGLKLCTDPTCVLFPPPKSRSIVSPKIHTKVLNTKAKTNKIEGDNPWDWIKDLINRMANNHQPIEDIDGDDFSGDVSTLRGYNWKGRDCNDLDKSIHPGILNTQGSATTDWNCNGIHGADPSTKVSYEEMLCGNSSQRGLIVVGDSFGAHFEIPPSYMNASEINNQTYADLLFVLENEFDWPQRSGFTGFDDNTTSVLVDSLYKRLRERNLCNHRDYQNVGVNGARSGAMDSNVIRSIARNTTDTPVLLIYELIGNDICSPHPDLGQMTTPEQFKVNILGSLSYLETILPAGSHVVFLGLADGRVLWDSLYNRTHPIGVPYINVYNFLNCLQISPCWVWMNDNETVRDAGAQRATELNAVYTEIIGNNTYANFDMVYYDFPFAEIDKMWQARGGQTWQLIEPVDGFHPNQVAHSLIAEYLWGQLETDHPDFLGPVNINNDVIFKMFGDQGGY